MTAILNNEVMAKPAVWLEAHGDCLYQYAMFRLRHVSAAEVAVQETLLAAQSSTNTSQSEGSERTWLIAILRHQIIAHCGRSAGKPDEFAGDEDEKACAFFETSGDWLGHWREEMAPTDWQFDTTSAVKRNSVRQTLDRCLSELPRTMSLAFMLREIDGLSLEDVCDVLHISRSNLCSLLHQARLRLRRSLEAEWIRGNPPEPTSKGIARDTGTLKSAGLEQLRSDQKRFWTFVRFPKVLRLIGWSE